MGKKRTITCSKCGGKNHNILSCGKVKFEPNTVNGKGSPSNVPPFGVRPPRSGGEHVGVVREVSDVESVAERLRITTPAYPEVEHVGRSQPSPGYGSVISGGKRLKVEPELRVFMKSDRSQIVQGKLPASLGGRAVFASPEQYWEAKGHRKPSPGYSAVGKRLPVGD